VENSTMTPGKSPGKALGKRTPGKRKLASPGKNMFSNAKNPDMMLGFSNTSDQENATAVLDEWSALSIEERSENPFSPGPLTRNRRKSVTDSTIKKTPAKAIEAKAEMPVNMPSFESEPVTQPSPTNARASSPVKNDPIAQPLTLTRDHTSTLFFAGVVALFAIALAVLILGGAVSSAVVPTDVVGVAAVPVPDLPVAKTSAQTSATKLGGGAGGQFRVVEELEAQIRELDGELESKKLEDTDFFEAFVN